MGPFNDAECERIAAFQADLADSLRKVLSSLGCKGLSASLSPSEVCLAYANYRSRRIRTQPRRVYRSDALGGRTDSSSEERAAIDGIEARFAMGADLYAHQSTSVRDPLSTDGLLADWHIQHLHLGLADGRPTVAPFVRRTAKVLLVRVIEDAAFFIDCLPHGTGDDPPWWDIDLPETLHRNWPESLAHLKVAGFGTRLSWEDHRKLRPGKGKGCNFTTLVTTSDGTSYLLSHGMVASGHSTGARTFANAIQTKVTEVALAHGAHERLVVQGDHRELHLHVEPR